MSNTKLTKSNLFSVLIGFTLFTYSVFLIGKMAAGAHLSSDELLLLTAGMVVNAAESF